VSKEGQFSEGPATQSLALVGDVVEGGAAGGGGVAGDVLERGYHSVLHHVLRAAWRGRGQYSIMITH